MITIRKTIIFLLLGCFSAWLVFACWVHLSYASNLPAAPNEKAGRIYRMVVNHGCVRYGTEGEIRTVRRVSNFQMIAMVCLLIGIILVVRYDDFHQNKRI